MVKISIIVPVYNVEKYLPKCIDSILNQTFSNFELILIDDGSTDSSGEICDKYALIDDRIIVIHKENGGQCSARNIGLDISSGKYIGFVDSDDFIRNDMYEELYSKIERNHGDIIKSNFATVIDGKIERTKSTGNITIYNSQMAFDNLINKPYSYSKHFKPVMWDGLYKQDLFDEIRFPEGYTYEELFVLPKIYLKADKLIHLDETLYFYTKNKNGTVEKGLTEKALKSIIDWKEIHYLIYNIYPQYSKATSLRWIERYINAYYEIINKGDVDKQDYYKKFIRFDLKINLKHFFEVRIGVMNFIYLNLFIKNPSIYIFLKNNRMIKGI